MERDRIIKEYLAVKNRIKKRSMAEREGDLKLEGELAETFNPIIKSNQKAASEIQKSIKPLNEQMVEMNRNFEKTNILKTNSSDTTDRYYGIMKDKDKGFWMGRKKIEFVDDNTMKVDDTLYTCTEGLWSLINDINPQAYSSTNPRGYTEKDLDAYTALVHQTDVINHPANVGKTSRPHLTVKFRKILSRIEEDRRKSLGIIGKKQSKKRSGSSSKGSGVNFLPSDINSLKEKLQLLVGEFTAGNKTTRNQIVAILDNLKGRKEISKKEYNQVNSLLQ